MLLVADQEAERLFVIANIGYPGQGAGAEVPMDAGAIGVVRLAGPASAVIADMA